jgi:oxalate decarboxylase/phosphoglucose isomerase-like protein (cupin superfamily)
VPQNHQHQYVNTGDEPLRLVIVQNRLIKYLGYDTVVYLEDAPEFSGAEATAGAAA